MRLLRRRPLGEHRDVLACVRQALPLLEAGLRPLDRLVAGGDAAADVAAIDAGGRLVLIVCAVEAEPAAVLRALECAAWCAEHGGVASRLDPALAAGAAPRAMVIAARFGERTLRLLRTLGPAAPVALECRVFDDGAEALVSFEPVADAVAAGTPAPPPGPAVFPPGGPSEKPSGAGVAGSAAPAGASGAEPHIGRLKFTEAFR